MHMNMIIMMMLTLTISRAQHHHDDAIATVATPSSACSLLGELQLVKNPESQENHRKWARERCLLYRARKGSKSTCAATRGAPRRCAAPIFPMGRVVDLGRAADRAAGVRRPGRQPKHAKFSRAQVGGRARRRRGAAKRALFFTVRVLAFRTSRAC